MYYWRLRVNPSPGKGGDYPVYIKTGHKYIDAMIVDMAVRSGDLLDTFAEYVDKVEEITSEEYHRYMWD